MIITHWLQALIAVFLFCKEVEPLSQGLFQDLVFFSSFFLHYSSYKNLVYAFWLSPLFYLDLSSRYCSKACFENIESLAVKVSSLRHVVSTTRHPSPPPFHITGTLLEKLASFTLSNSDMLIFPNTFQLCGAEMCYLSNIDLPFCGLKCSLLKYSFLVYECPWPRSLRLIVFLTVFWSVNGEKLLANLHSEFRLFQRSCLAAIVVLGFLQVFIYVV